MHLILAAGSGLLRRIAVYYREEAIMTTATQERNEEPMTFEQIREMFQEIGRKQAETARILQESGKETDRRMKETEWI
jgi:hypothetical protein